MKKKPYISDWEEYNIKVEKKLKSEARKTTKNMEIN
jgi:hypothetical protein